MCNSLHVPQSRANCAKKPVAGARCKRLQQRNKEDQGSGERGLHEAMVTSFVACYRPVEQFGANYE